MYRNQFEKYISERNIRYVYFMNIKHLVTTQFLECFVRKTAEYSRGVIYSIVYSVADLLFLQRRWTATRIAPYVNSYYFSREMRSFPIVIILTARAIS